MKKIYLLTVPVVLAVISIFSCTPAVTPTMLQNTENIIALGVAEFQKGDYSGAKLFFENALKSAYTIDNTAEIINSMQNLAEVYLQSGSYDKASNFIFTARNYSAIEEVTNYNFSLNLTTGRYYEVNQSYGDATNYYMEALKWADSDVNKAVVYNDMGKTELNLGSTEYALDWINKAIPINRDKKLYGPLADNYFILGQINDQTSDTNQALNNYKDALTNDCFSERSLCIIEDLKQIAGEYLKSGNHNLADYYLDRAVNAAVFGGYTDQIQAISNMY